MFVALMTQVNWITFAPIMEDVASDYDVSEDSILLLTAVYMIAYIPVNFPATWAIDKYGLKWGTGVGVILTGVFGLLRAFAGDNFELLMFAQVMTAIGQPFVLNSFTKLSVSWFPESEKATATGLGTVSILVGIIVGMVATPWLYENHGIDYVLWVYGIFSIVSMLLYLIFVKNSPENPPSASAGSKAFDFRGMRELFRSRDFNILMILVFVGLGSFNAISSEIETIFDKFEDDTNAAGQIGAIMVFGGLIGAGILSALSDKLHKRKIFLILAMFPSIPLTIILPTQDNFTLVLVLSFIFGFFLVSALPIALIYAAEITHPISEEASNGLMMTLGQVSGILLLISFNMDVITVLFAIGFIFSLILNDLDQQQTPSGIGN
jgi:MFS family permease